MVILGLIATSNDKLYGLICSRISIYGVIIKQFLANCVPVPQPALTCQNDTLAVTWPINLIYDSTVTQIPDDLRQRLRASGQTILNIVITKKTPPLVPGRNFLYDHRLYIIIITII